MYFKYLVFDISLGKSLNNKIINLNIDYIVTYILNL